MLPLEGYLPVFPQLEIPRITRVSFTNELDSGVLREKWTILFGFARVGLRKEVHEQREAEFLRPARHRRRAEIDPGGHSQLRWFEPDGIGEDGVRALGLEASQ